jgi:hypothetical protein
VESLEHILDQCNTVLAEVESIAFKDVLSDKHGEQEDEYQSRGRPLTPAELERLSYLEVHLKSLQTTISVLQQTLYTAQSIIWARYATLRVYTRQARLTRLGFDRQSRLSKQLQQSKMRRPN